MGIIDAVSFALTKLKELDMPSGTEGFVPNDEKERSYVYWGDPCRGPREVTWGREPPMTLEEFLDLP